MKPNKFFVILVIAIVTLLVLGGFGYYMVSQSLSNGTRILSQKLADEQLADERLSQLNDLEEQYKKLTPLLGDIEAALPKTKQQSELALQLQDIATQSGMSITNLTFQPNTTLPNTISQTVKLGDVLAIPVTFNLGGSYAQLQSFLQKQERLNRYTSVTNLNINRGERGSLTFTVTLHAYVKP
ncbi:MAG TPA: type 4a pilus biogenesis protein PilO [Candidatus Dormibacteraeota bacterium]|nr:type 4a pilus biogenesis protein PilO [Candidatus Dormibacteraeota bacterium]